MFCYHLISISICYNCSLFCYRKCTLASKQFYVVIIATSNTPLNVAMKIYLTSLNIFNAMYHPVVVVVVVFTQPLPWDGGMAEDHGAPEAGQLPKAWTRGRKETESHQRASAAKSP